MEYVNIINDRYIKIVKMSTIYPKFKIEVLDQSEQNIIKEIYQDIDANSSSSISINYKQGTRRSCNLSIINKSGEFTPSPLTGMFWIGSKFKLYIGLKDPSNEDIYWFTQGVYYVNNPSDTHQFSNKVVNISGVDKFGMLTSDLGYNQLTGSHFIAAGRKIYSIIRDILMLDIGNGFVIDQIEPLFDPIYKDEVLPYDINKGAGTYFGDILVELANILGCNIYYDINGRLNIRSGTTDLSYSQDAPVWDFFDIFKEYMSSSLNYNYTDVTNVVTVIGNNVNDKIYSYTAENNNILSPTRINYIGRKEIAPIETAMAYSEQRAKEYAEYKLNQLSILQMSIGFSSPLIPHLDVDKIINITDAYYKYQQQRFIIQSINMPINTKNLMSINASNISSLPYYDLLVGG